MPIVVRYGDTGKLLASVAKGAQQSYADRQRQQQMREQAYYRRLDMQQQEQQAQQQLQQQRLNMQQQAQNAQIQQAQQRLQQSAVSPLRTRQTAPAQTTQIPTNRPEQTSSMTYTDPQTGQQRNIQLTNSQGTVGGTILDTTDPTAQAQAMSPEQLQAYQVGPAQQAATASPTGIEGLSVTAQQELAYIEQYKNTLTPKQYLDATTSIITRDLREQGVNQRAEGRLEAAREKQAAATQRRIVEAKRRDLVRQRQDMIDNSPAVARYPSFEEYDKANPNLTDRVKQRIKAQFTAYQELSGAINELDASMGQEPSAVGGRGGTLPQGNGRPLTAEEASAFMSAANGNKEVARQLAKANGFTF